MKSSLFLYTLFSTLIGRCFAFQWTRTNLRSIRRTSTGSTSLSLAKDSGIFEYTGSGPPSELAKLFGLKVDEKTVKKQTTKTSSKKKSEGKKPIDKRDVEKVEDLENQLISKYKSSAYKDISDGDDDEWEDPALEEIRKRKLKKQKFEGFNPQGSKVSNKEPVTEKSRLEVEEGDRIVPPPRKSLLLGRLTNRVKESTTSLKKDVSAYSIEDDFYDHELQERLDPEEEEDSYGGGAEVPSYKKEQKLLEDASRSGPLNAVQGYRLRKPAPISAEQQLKMDQALAQQASREAAALERKKAKKQLDATNFAAFDFTDANGDSSSLTETDEDQLFTTKSFTEIGVDNAAILRNLERLRIFNPTKIQELSLPILSAGNNVVMQAQTGSGKTLAYLLPLLNVIDPVNKKVQAIVLAPSRELVTQIAQVAENVFKDTGINVISIIGGANVRNQVSRLREDRPQVVVATPGRLAELVFGLKKLRLGTVRALVVDEVDNLLQEPFVGEMQVLWEAMPLLSRLKKKREEQLVPPTKPERIRPGTDSELLIDYDGEEEERSSDEEDDENSFDDDFEENGDEEEEDGAEETELSKRFVCLASATANSPAVRNFADSICGPDQWTAVAAKSAAQLPNTISHGLVSCARIKSLEILKKILNAQPEVKCALIFVNDPYRVNVVVDKLEESGIIAAPLHGETSKDDRKEIISRLRDGRLKLAVTTELAARGLDLPDLTHVINFELPTDAQHYVHRAGRCGRAGRKGLVISFANPDTKFVIRRFGKQLGVKVKDCEVRSGQVFLKGV